MMLDALIFKNINFIDHRTLEITIYKYMKWCHNSFLFLILVNLRQFMLHYLAQLYWNGQNLCVHQLLRLYLRVREGGTVSRLYRHIRQAAIPARVVLGTAVFCDQSNQYLVYEFPFCAMHMRVSSVSLPYLQNRLPSLIISAILAQ